MFYFTLALITRPPDGVLLAATPLAARASLRNSTAFHNRSLGVAYASRPDVV